MDDKLINIIITVAVIAGWAVQFFLKPKEKDDERHFDEEDEEETRRTSQAPRRSGDNPYAEDPYTKVQEDIRRMIAERQAAERAASQSGRSANSQPPLSPVEKARRAREAARTSGESQTAARQLSPAPMQTAGSAGQQQQSRPSTATADRTLRPIPQAPTPNRSFPATRPKPAAPTPAFSAPQGRFSAPLSQSASPFASGSVALITTANAPTCQPAGAGRRTRSQHYDALRGRLRDPAAAREAIVLREILGPPTALRNDHQF